MLKLVGELTAVISKLHTTRLVTMILKKVYKVNLDTARRFFGRVQIFSLIIIIIIDGRLP